MVDHNGIITSRHVGFNAGDEKKIELEIIELINNTLPDSLKIEVDKTSE